MKCRQTAYRCLTCLGYFHRNRLTPHLFVRAGKEFVWFSHGNPACGEVIVTSRRLRRLIDAERRAGAPGPFAVDSPPS